LSVPSISFRFFLELLPLPLPCNALTQHLGKRRHQITATTCYFPLLFSLCIQRWPRCFFQVLPSFFSRTDPFTTLFSFFIVSRSPPNQQHPGSTGGPSPTLFFRTFCLGHSSHPPPPPTRFTFHPWVNISFEFWFRACLSSFVQEILLPSHFFIFFWLWA